MGTVPSKASQAANGEDYFPIRQLANLRRSLSMYVNNSNREGDISADEVSDIATAYMTLFSAENSLRRSNGYPIITDVPSWVVDAIYPATTLT